MIIGIYIFIVFWLGICYGYWWSWSDNKKKDRDE